MTRNPTSSAPAFFDAHLDLAYLAETGRDLHAPTDDCRGRYQPASITLPELATANVTHCLGTIFTEAITDPTAPDAETGAFAYPADDALAAWKAGMRQLKLYQAWRDANVISLMPRRGEAARKAQPGQSPAADPKSTAPLTLGILMECADPIETPDQLAEWADAGVIAIGMSWWHASRYAAGNGIKPNSNTPGSSNDGLTDLGRALATHMDELNIVHDLSHLSQRSTDDLLAHTSAPVIASHSNCRALFPGMDATEAQRHLADETIAEIARRGGVIGINLYSRFLTTNPPPARAQLRDVIAHIEHICTITGSKAHVALGSDADGGFPATRLPEGINQARDYPRLAEALCNANWNDKEIAGFCSENWLRFWRGA